MYLCEYSFNKEDPNIPGSSMDEVDYYAWTPAKFHSEIPNHRLTLLKNLVTGKYEFHRVYMNTEVKKLAAMLIMVQTLEKGLTEVAHTTESLQEAVDWGNREWDKHHYGPGQDHHDDKVCQHVYPHKSSFCEGAHESQISSTTPIKENK